MSALQIITWCVDGIVILAIAGLTMLACSFLHLVALHYRRRARGIADEAALMDTDLPAALPRVLIQVPCYNEGKLIERVLASLGGLDWPKDRLAIQVIDQSDDGTTDMARAAAAALAKTGIKADVIFRSVREGFKAGALREGLEKSDAPFVAVFDVDFIAPRDFLKRCMRAMLADERLGFVQARIEFENAEHNWLTRAQRLVLDAHCAVEQASRSWAGLPFQFDGSGGIWRRAAIDEAGGWDGKTLSEDLDLSYRTYLKGWRGRYLLSATVSGEMPEALGDWRVQQSRWSKGYMEVTVKLLPAIWRSSWSFGARIAATLHVGLAAFHPLLITALVAGAVSLALHRELVPELLIAPGLLLAVGILAIVGMTFPGHRLFARGGIGSYLVRIGHVPPLYVYLAFANTRGVIDALRGRASAFTRTPKKGANDPAPEID
ncbi:MAG TPA: glycosyltransferase [Alphaproteobacteria bacterium]|nr:glycosyltransferase [Alphaproteobacteria bacterium]